MAFSLSKFVKDIFQPGWRERKEAKNVLQQQMSTQDAEKAKMISEANRANELNRSWATGYANSLSNLPQLAYNMGLGQLHRGAQSATDDVYQNMANRGITGGVDLKALAGNQYNLSRGISQLQGQRLANMADVKGQQYNIMSGINQGALGNLINAYSHGGDSARTSYINQLNQISQAKAGAGSPVSDLLGTIISGYLNPVGTVTGGVMGSQSKPDTSYLNDLQFRLRGY